MKTEEGIQQLNDVEIYYKIIGSGEPLVIVHGGPGLGHNYLLPHFERLTKTFKVIFYDQRASGKSTGHGKPVDITMDNFINDLEAFRKFLAIPRLNLLGQSWGGLLSLNYAITYPENLNTLILLESAGASSAYLPQFRQNIANRITPETKRAMYSAGLLGTTEEDSAEAFQKYLRLHFRAYFYDQNQTDKLYLDYFDNDTVHKCLLSHERLTTYLQNYDLFGALNKISCPTLIIHGEFDPIPFQQIQRIQQNIHGSEFVLLRHCGHFAYVEKSEKCFDLIESFLVKHVQTKRSDDTNRIV